MNALATAVLSAAGRGLGPLVADRHRALQRSELTATCAELVGVVRDVSGQRAPVLAVDLPLGTDAVAFLLTAIVHDLTVVLLDPSWPEPRRTAVLDEVHPGVVVTASGVQPMARGDVLDGPRKRGYIAMSSGSTGGRPKGVLASWDNVGRFVPDGATALELDPWSIWAEATHPSYDMPMTNLLIALAAGAGVRLGSYADSLRPLRFVDRVAATHVRLAPRSAELAAAERRPVRPGFRVWGSGGDRLLTQHVVALHEAGVPAVVNTYGTSETIGFASAARLPAGGSIPHHRGVVTVGAGSVGEWSVRLTAREGHPMLVVSSPGLPDGYRFGGPSNVGYPRWLSPDAVLTGDLGAAEAGAFFCLGRTGRTVKRNGLFVDLDDIDRRIGEHVGVTTHTVLTQDGAMLTLVETSAGADRLSGQLAALLSPERRPERLVLVDQIPRLANGKVDLARAVAVVKSTEPAA
jgi:acyl-coenzyme A synthetase/AMP-(fatty) acid ligase